MGRQLQALAPIFALAIFLISPASAQNDAPISDQDCTAILENFAAAPKAVAPDVVKACQEILAMAPAAGTAAAAAPCTPNSVYCWGDWAALAPAAAGGGAGSTDIIKFVPTSEELGLGPQLDGPDDPPFTGCAPGASCGFSVYSPVLVTVAAEANTQSVEDTIARFVLATDATSFINDPGPDQLESSVPMDTKYFKIGDFVLVDSRGGPTPNGEESLVTASSPVSCPDCVNGNAVETLIYAAGRWANLNDEGEEVQGFFAWGTAITQADLTALNDTGPTLIFDGNMAKHTDIQAHLEIDFGDLRMDGEWRRDTGEGSSFLFGASGPVSGPSFIADEFSAEVLNANSGAKVEGAVVGILDDLAAVHSIDVMLSEGLLRDVGTLKETRDFD